MKTVSNLIQIFALGACLATHVCGSGDLRMPGVRRALRTMDGSASHAGFPDWSADGSVDSHLG
jgi:hypothetical protein